MKLASASSVLGAAGEHYVMSQLLRRGMIAALAPMGVPNADLVVTDDIGDRLCAVQVKARNDIGADGGWHMRAKHEKIYSENLFYAFVTFPGEIDLAPTCYIVPSTIVATTIRESHMAWLAKPGKNGQPHKDTDLRRFLPDYDKMGLMIGRGEGWMIGYRSAFHLLEKASVEPR